MTFSPKTVGYSQEESQADSRQQAGNIDRRELGEHGFIDQCVHGENILPAQS